jgi:hypothetical protein
MRPPRPHRLTTAHLQAAYPFVGATDSRAAGPLLGRDLTGASFCFDPWQRYAAGDITGPNMVVVGQIGRGKSSFVKTMLWREIALGRKAWVIDPKGEYAALARACGTDPLKLAPGGPVRLNPLDILTPAPAPIRTRVERPAPLGPSAGDGPVGYRRGADLLSSVAAASLGRSLGPAERAAVDLAVRSAGGRRGAPEQRGMAPTVPSVIAALLAPEPDAAAEVRTDVAGLAADGRLVALELRRLVEGDLGGMFDGPTSVSVDLEAPLVVLDLSALYRSAALGIVMTCATAWLHAAMTSGDGEKRLVVVDEAWAVLHDLPTARWLQASFKLARSLGGAHLAVLHRLSDLRAAGSDGSQQQHLAEGLLADAETRVVFAQPPGESRAAADALGLSSTEEELLPQLPRGVALWKVGDRSTLVRHLLSPHERAFIDTDAAMVERPSLVDRAITAAPSPPGAGARREPGAPRGVGVGR